MKRAQVRERKLRKQIEYTNRVCVENGLIRSSDGNISIRLDADRFLITPSGLYKRCLKRKHILTVDGKGQLIRGKGPLKPSSELLMHLEAYRQREDIGAVLHAHPPYSTALTIAGIPFPTISPLKYWPCWERSQRHHMQHLEPKIWPDQSANRS